MAAPLSAELLPWRPQVSPYLIAMSVMLATFMEVLDTSVANVALPHIAGSLASSVDDATWVLTSYLVANAVVLPMTGWLGRRFGRKRLLLFCIVVFTFASALCGAADSLMMLILARVLQGAAGGALQPVSQAIIFESFPPEKRGMGMSLFAMGVVVAPIIGPTIGGWVTDNYSWRWVFYINVPFGAAALWCISQFVEDPPYLQHHSKSRLDLMGFSLLVIWLATLQFVLDRGQELDWTGSAAITWCIGISAVSFVAFVIRELTVAEPLVNLRIFFNRNFAVGTGLIFMLGGLLYGTTSAIPLFLQDLLGYTATNAGIALSPRGMGAFAAAVFAGRLMGIVKPRTLIFAGFVGIAVSVYLLGGINLDIGMSEIIWPIVIAGVAIALVFVPLSVVTMGSLPTEQTGAATGIFNLMRNLGGSFGISLLETFVTRESQKTQAILVTHTNLINPYFQNELAAAQQALAPHVGSANALHEGQQLVYNLFQQQAASLAYVDLFQLLTLFCLGTLPIVFLLKNIDPKKAQGSPH